ncbi:hypothetical protein CKAH01_10918 [Colletotrichum kahawae]|uniref:Uncharacterized protein n=1 Tax=Colletotrichum kahawae TaxID=34407 RepID=A0AAE0CWV4_COLKA|nr:hypothetical protein CKAH01_10918 [Colletotrichum kahawae]
MQPPSLLAILASVVPGTLACVAQMPFVALRATAGGVTQEAAIPLYMADECLYQTPGPIVPVNFPSNVTEAELNQNFVDQNGQPMSVEDLNTFTSTAGIHQAALLDSVICNLTTHSGDNIELQAGSPVVFEQTQITECQCMLATLMPALQKAFIPGASVRQRRQTLSKRRRLLQNGDFGDIAPNYPQTDFSGGQQPSPDVPEFSGNQRAEPVPGDFSGGQQPALLNPTFCTTLDDGSLQDPFCIEG